MRITGKSPGGGESTGMAVILRDNDGLEHRLHTFRNTNRAAGGSSVDKRIAANLYAAGIRSYLAWEEEHGRQDS